MAQSAANSEGIENWLKLKEADSVGPVTFFRLKQRFGSVENAMGASSAQLAKVEGIGARTAERIARSRSKFDENRELEQAAKLGVWLVTAEDVRYPVALKAIHDPPPVLYVKGRLERNDNLAIAIVGSRRCSLYGQEQASSLSHLLAATGVTIVSGMARGIDTFAHHGCLSAMGRTIGVQGCGLARIFPPENEKLFQMISESGACVSELALETEPLAQNFPARNRIIAGLALATMVVEAPLRSGALITARAAMECNREVMAVPGKVDSPLSRGSHKLIKQGAKLVETIEDVMEGLGSIGQQLKPQAILAKSLSANEVEAPLFDPARLNLGKKERLIYDCLGAEPLHIEDVIAEVDLAPGDVHASLISLRLKGLIRQLQGNMFMRKKYG